MTTSTGPYYPAMLEPSRFNHFSSFTRLKQTVVRIQRMIERLRPNKQHNWRPTEYQPQVRELQEAEKIVIRFLQRQHFKEEITVLRTLPGNQDKFKQREAARERNKQVKTTSNIYKLDPYLDEDGVLRVGGRLSHANSPTEIKHPMIIPRNSHVTTLLTRYHRGKQHHQGCGMTHNAIR